jgi:hypothetical protein
VLAEIMRLCRNRRELANPSIPIGHLWVGGWTSRGQEKSSWVKDWKEMVVHVWDHEERSHKFVNWGEWERNLCKECSHAVGEKKSKSSGREGKKETLKVDGCPGRAGLVLWWGHQLYWPFPGLNQVSLLSYLTG